jgi:hypothetical protein
MAEPPPDSLLNAIDADRARAAGALADARRRVRERARDALSAHFPAAEPTPQRAPSLQPASPQPIPSPAADRKVSMRLPSGRRVAASLSPAPARRSDLAAVAQAASENDRRAFAALQQQRGAIERLKRSQEALERKLERLQQQADDAVVSLTDRLQRSTRQVRDLSAQSRSMLGQTGTAAKTAAAQLQQVQSLAVTQQAQNLTNVIGTAQATAYGEHGSVLAANNLLLTGNQLLWTFLAPFSQVLGASVATSTVLACLAPLGSLVTGYAAVGSRVSEPEPEPERFVTGVSAFEPGESLQMESLRDDVSEALFKKLRQRSDVPVILTQIDDIPEGRFLAYVKDGTVFIILTKKQAKRVQVAWMVDTGVADG